MSVFEPRDPLVLWSLLALLGANLVLGFLVTRMRSIRQARIAGWILVFGGIVLIERLCHGEAPGFTMAAIVFVLYPAMKAVVCIETQALGEPRLQPLSWFAFAGGWFGMKPGVFGNKADGPLAGAWELIWFGVSRTLMGVGIMLFARWFWGISKETLTGLVAGYIAAAMLVPGISLIIHFGVPNIVSGAWRLAGYDCRTLFRTPFRSHSLSEFWGRRWNLAFNEMVILTFYRPMVSLVGKKAATALTFVWSGLLHELALSFPVGGGYGLPTLYFCLHGGLVFVERQLEKRGMPIDRIGWVGRLWTFAWIAVPLPLLFHPAFLTGIIWPFMGMEMGH